MKFGRFAAVAAFFLVQLHTGSARAQRAWIDPETGKLGSPPPGMVVPDEDAGDGGAAAAPLVVEPGRTSAGGIMIDLTGRPLYSFEAKLTPEGKVVTDCIRQDD